MEARKNFRSLNAFRKYATKQGLRVKLVTRSKTNDYYQAIHKVQGIVGFFNTGRGGGSIRGGKF